MNIKTKTVEIDGKKFKISKLPLRRYAELFSAMNKIPSMLVEWGDITEEVIIQKLPQLLSDAFPEFIEMVSIGSGIDKGILEDTDAGSFTEVLVAIFEVNDFGKLKKNLGTMWKMASAEQSAKPKK